MNVGRIALLVVVLFAVGLIIFLVPVLSQSGEKGAGNDSPEFPAKREVFREHMEQGRQLLKAEKGREAEAAFRQALSVFPGSRSSEAESGIAEALFLQGKTREAVEQYRLALSGASGSIDLLLKYGRMCDRAGLHEEALAAYRRAFQVQGEDSGFPVQLSENASAAEIRQKAKQALALYHPEPPE